MTILVIGDSFSDKGFSTFKHWPTIISERLGGYPVVNHAVGGAGYITYGHIPNQPHRFSRQILDRSNVVPSSVKLGLIVGSVNDEWAMNHWADHLNYRRLVWEAHREFMLAYPRIPLQVVSPQWAGPNAKPANIDKMRQCIWEEMWGYDWQIPFIDPNPGTDYANWWFPPTRPDLWDTDKFHPNQAGHVRIADKLEPAIRRHLGL